MKKLLRQQFNKDMLAGLKPMEGDSERTLRSVELYQKARRHMLAFAAVVGCLLLIILFVAILTTWFR